MLLIQNCNLVNMAGIYEQRRDLLVEGTKVREIADKIEPQPGWEVIDAAGRLVTPGIIDSHAHIGLTPTGVGDFDGNEYTNPATPGIRGLDALNPADPAFDVALKNGVTTVITGPGSANVIGGTFAALKTYGKTLDEAVINPEICMKTALGENPKFAYGKNRGKAPATRMMSAAIFREQLMKARDYRAKWLEHKAKLDAGEEAGEFSYDLNMHSLMRVFDGMMVKIHCHQADDIMTAIRISEEFGLRYTLDHCTEGYLIPEKLKEHNCRVIIGPIFGAKSKFELKHKSMNAGRILEENGIEFSVMTDNPVIPMEGLLMQLALLHKHGMSRETALKAVTINAAKNVDLEGRLGTLEPGKDADIVIWNVDPLDTMSDAGVVIIDGKVRYEKKEEEIDVDYKGL